MDIKYAIDVLGFARDVLGFRPDAKQAELLSLAMTPAARRVILNCTRQWGKSTITGILAVHRAYFHMNSEILVAGPAERQSGEFLYKMTEFVRRLGIKPRGDGRNGVSLLFPNGSRIVGLPGKGSIVLGFSRVSLLIVDEASWVDDDHYFAIKPMTTTCDGAVWLMSTPNGQRGFFYDAWNDSERWTRVSVPATECPRISKRQLEEDLVAMGERTFKQFYMCQFGDAEQAVFRMDLLRAALRADVPALDLAARFVPLGSSYVIGVDFGQRNDYTAIVVVERVRRLGERNMVTYEQKEEISFQAVWAERVPLGTDYTEVVGRIRDVATSAALGKHCQLVIDATGLGAPTRDFLKKERLDCKILPVVITGAEKGGSNGTEWRVPKRDLVQGLQVLFEQGTLRISAGARESGRLLDELAGMRVSVGNTGHESFQGGGRAHDDLVVALALACWGAAKYR